MLFLFYCGSGALVGEVHGADPVGGGVRGKDERNYKRCVMDWAARWRWTSRLGRCMGFRDAFSGHGQRNRGPRGQREGHRRKELRPAFSPAVFAATLIPALSMITSLWLLPI